ncbi:hypothetical protein LBMAG27_23470 [Bacteroidota bacterium]|nr:hypothetical protein LBMAG27_23470 [Bacteroidota bacterium]
MSLKLNRSEVNAKKNIKGEFVLTSKKNKPINDLQKLILSAPTWTNAEYKNFLKGRINKR